jgi:hypothetical protein
MVKERLGHASITTTEKYLHALPGADTAALEALTSFRGRKPSSGLAPPADSRDAELAEMRDLVAKLHNMLGKAI